MQTKSRIDFSTTLKPETIAILDAATADGRLKNAFIDRAVHELAIRLGLISEEKSK